MLLFCFLTLIANSQQRNYIVSSDKNDCDLSCCIRKFFQTNYTRINGCGSGICFIKFSISSQGNITDIYFNEGTPSFLETFLKESFFSTNGQWEPGKKENVSVQSKTFFLPINYQLGKCKESRDTTLFIKNEIYTASPVPGLTDPADKKNDYSFLHMLDFKNTSDDHIKFSINPSYPPLNCTILSPVILKKPLVENGFPSNKKE